MLPLPFYHYKEEYDQRLPAHFDQTVSTYETTGRVAVLMLLHYSANANIYNLYDKSNCTRSDKETDTYHSYSF